MLYDETRRAVDLQLQIVESLNNRAQQLVGFSAVVISVVAAFDIGAGDSRWERAFALAAVGMFALAGGVALHAWRFGQYRDDPDVKKAYADYRHSSEVELRDQLIGNRFGAMEQNDRVMKKKTQRVREATGILVVGGILLIVLVVVRLFIGDAVPAVQVEK